MEFEMLEDRGDHALLRCPVCKTEFVSDACTEEGTWYDEKDKCLKPACPECHVKMM